jgi:inhibitor of the pro-sigma K processing machinery
MDVNVVIAFVLGLLLIYLIGRVMVIPLRLVWKLVFNAFVGGFVLWLINGVGYYINLHIPLNPITALTVGFLGIPGIIILIVIQQFIIK